MTILLLRSYATYAQGATVDLDNATEAALVAQGRASYVGTSLGGVFAPLTAAEQQNLRDSGSLTAVQAARVATGQAGTARGVATQLISAYLKEREVNDSRGHYLKGRTGLDDLDKPTIIHGISEPTKTGWTTDSAGYAAGVSAITLVGDVATNGEIVEGDPLRISAGGFNIIYYADTFDTGTNALVLKSPLLYAVPGSATGLTRMARSPTIDWDSCTQRYYLFGSDLSGSNPLSIAQKTLGRDRGLRGGSIGAYWYPSGNGYRIGTALSSYSTGGSGNVGKDPVSNWYYDGNITYWEGFLDGDTLFLGGWLGTTVFNLWVEDCLITEALYSGTAGANIAASADGFGFTTSGTNNGGVKIKFPSANRRRRIRLSLQAGNAGIYDFYIKTGATLTPACKNPVRILSFGDSFWQYTGAGAFIKSMAQYFAESFGRDIDHINISKGGSSFLAGNTVAQSDAGTLTLAAGASFRLQFREHAAANTNVDVVFGLIGKNDDTNVAATLAEEVRLTMLYIRSVWPSAIIIMATTATGPTAIRAGNDVTVEAAVAAGITAANAAGAGVETILLQTDPLIPPFLRGTGCTWAPYASALLNGGSSPVLTTSGSALTTGTNTNALSLAWLGPTGTYSLNFTNAAGPDLRRCTLTNASRQITGLSAAITPTSTTLTDGTGNTDILSGPAATTDNLHPSARGHEVTGLMLAERVVEVLRKYAV